MITAPPGIVATYRAGTAQNGRTTYFQRAVVAFTEDGEALILDDQRTVCTLRRADTYANFLGLRDEDSPPIVQLLSAAGWYLIADDGTGEDTTWPLVAWALRRDGTVTAVEADDRGDFAPLDEHDDDADYAVAHESQLDDTLARRRAARAARAAQEGAAG